MMELRTRTATEAPLRSQLDIVQDCSDLKGTFPENVELSFVYWEHGQDDGGFSAQEKARKLAPYCLDADVIAMELYETLHDTPSDAQKEFSLINDAIKDANERLDNPRAFKGKPKVTQEERYGLLPISTAWHQCVELYNRMLELDEGRNGRGLGKVPVFLPVDIMKKYSTPNSEWPGAEKYALDRAEEHRMREEVTIRQLNSEVQRLAVDGERHKIVVIYGSNHTPLSVATRELGARTSRVFLDSISPGPLAHASRLLRYPSDKGDFDEAIMQAKWGGGVSAVIKELGVEIDPAYEAGLSERLMVLTMRAAHKALVSSDLKAFYEAQGVIDSTYGDSMNRRQERACRQAMRSLIELASNLK